MTLQGLETAVKFFFDIARLIPGLSTVLGLEPVIVDGLELTEMVREDIVAIIGTPQWARMVGNAKKLIEAQGGSVTTAPGSPHIVTSYVAPPHQSPQDFNLHRG